MVYHHRKITKALFEKYRKKFRPYCSIASLYLWEVSGGACMAGEESEDAVKRELLEETGIDVSDFDGGYVFTYKRENPGEGDNYFVDVYKFVSDFDESDVKVQECEADGFMLATHDQIKEFADQGIFLHYDSIKRVFED